MYSSVVSSINIPSPLISTLFPYTTLFRSIRGEQSEEVLRGVGEGAQTIDDMDVSAKDRLKAAELLGKRYGMWTEDRKSTRLNSSHVASSYAVFCLKKKEQTALEVVL